jgi:hypothetical protein
MTDYEEEEELVIEETEEAWDELLEDDEVSPEEQGFIIGWLEAGKSKKKIENEEVE